MKKLLLASVLSLTAIGAQARPAAHQWTEFDGRDYACHPLAQETNGLASTPEAVHVMLANIGQYNDIKVTPLDDGAIMVALSFNDGSGGIIYYSTPQACAEMRQKGIDNGLFPDPADVN